MSKRAILFLSSSWPHSKAFGGQLRALHTARALSHVGEITVTVVSSDANDYDAWKTTAAEFCVTPPIRPLQTPRRAITEKLRWVFDAHYLNIHGCVASLADRDRVLSSASEYDLIWILNSRTPNILQRWSWPRTHLDVDDVPSTYFRSSPQNRGNLRTVLKHYTTRIILKRRELLFDRRFTTLSVCSEADRRYLGGKNRIHVIPNGFEHPRPSHAPRSVAIPPRIGFIGLCSYPPNIEGIRWFLQTVWTRIRQAVPGVRFRLVGKHSNRALEFRAADVDALGWLDDPASEIATWSLMIVPIQLGGGTRIKIAEAFSRKCPVVSTHFGALGYDVRCGDELLLADDAAEFATACISLIRDPALAAEMAERAHQAFLEKWTWDAIAPRVWTAADDCLRRSAASGS
jgi:glycosyltransferase involved in cell wall biosynthesis